MKTNHVAVKVRNGEIDKALKFFKKQTFNSGHLLELRDRQEFIKPSVKKRETKQRAIYRQQYQNTIDD